MIRRPLQFETAVGTYTWPRYALEYDASQPLVLAMVDLPGADYAFDQLGGAPALKGTATHTLRFLLVGQPAAIETEMDEMRRICYLGARGSLVLADDAGVLRKCTARITAMPQISLGVRDRQRAPVILTFIQLSDFQDSEAVHEVFSITTSSQGVPITNPGNAVVRAVRLTLKNIFTNPKITNNSLDVPGTSTPYVFETTRDGSATSNWLEADAGAHTVRFSSNSGGTWADDSANVVLQDGQVGLFALAPGNNNLLVQGAAGASLEVDFFGAYV